MIRIAPLAAAILMVVAPLPASAQAICQGFAKMAMEFAERRVLGQGPQGNLDAIAFLVQQLGENSPAVRVARAMHRDIWNNPRITPEMAWRMSWNAPCGWPGASPGGAANQFDWSQGQQRTR